MTLAELRAEVLRRMDDSAGDVFSAADINTALNEGYEEISDATEWYETSDAVTFTTSTYYDLRSVLSKSILSIKRVFNDVTNFWLQTTNFRKLDDQDFRWEVSVAAPIRMLLRGLWWLGLFPKSDAASGTFTVKYSAIPAALSADGDTPGFPLVFHPALADYAAYDLNCQLREFAKAIRWWAAYQEKEKQLLLFVKGRGGIAGTRRMGGVYEP